MSSSDSLAKPYGRIEVSAPLGVSVKILDGDLVTIADRIDEIPAQLSVGLYTVRWSAGEKSEQKTVRLREGDVLLLQPESLASGSPASIDDQLAVKQLAALATAVEASLEQTEVIVFVSATDINTSSDVARNVQLRSIDAGSGRSTAEVKPCNGDRSLADGWSQHCYRVASGSYILRYESAERATLEQTVYVIEGRRTLVWLRYGHAVLTELRKGDAQLRLRRGIDPQRTRAVSFGTGVDGATLKQSLLLADVLLHWLAARTGELDAALLEGLGAIEDPYLRIYAAAVLLTRPLQATLRWNAPESALTMWTPPANVAAAHQLLDPLFAESVARHWPDLLCARWRLALADNGHDFAEAEIGLPAPPMLESSWRWAAAWSVERLIVDAANTPGLQALSLGAERTVPWLTWRAVDDKKRVEETSEPAAGTVVEALQAISELSAQIKEHGAPAGSLLSPQTLTLATAVERIGAEKLWDSSDGGLVNRVAGATGLPLKTLTSAADIAVKELQSSAATNYVTLYESDPNLGMFGGEYERDGYRLSLVEFRPTNSAEFLALDLLVESIKSKQPLEGVVTFYLHPTFNPPVESAAATNGRAALTCYATGGFTLGAKLANGTRLELNLAKDERLPKWFRDR